MAATVAGSVPLSVFPAGDGGRHAPNFNDIGKASVTVDVSRLQAELRGLHQRLELLEVAALVAAAQPANEYDVDRGSGSSSSGGAALRTTRVDEESVTDSLTAETQGEPPPSPLLRSSTTGSRKKNNAALHAELRDLAATVESLVASAKRRDKATSLKEKATLLARSMEIKRIQLAIDSRVTSDDLEVAVGATNDKIATIQSSVETALSDRFRRMQDVVHEQMASLLNMVQTLTQQQRNSMNQGNNGLRLLSIRHDDDDDSSDDERQKEVFDKAVTAIVHRVLHEVDSEGQAQRDAQSAAIGSLQEDYEIFKNHMEEKADRQDAMSSALEEAQARLEDTETNISTLTEELESLSQDMREAMDAASERQSNLDIRVQEAASLAADANGECAAIRLLVAETRRETLAEAHQDAENVVGRAEGRMKAEVSKARGDARAATERVSSELRRHIKKAEDEAEGFQGAIAGTRALSEKAFAGAAAAAARADECDELLQKAETRIGRRLDEAIHNQTMVAEDTLERVAAGESELARAESELRRLLANSGTEIEDLRKSQNQLQESSERATEELRVEMQDSLASMIIMDQDGNETSASGGGGGGARGRGALRSGGVLFASHTTGGNNNNCYNTNNGSSSSHGSNSPDLASLGKMLRRQNEETAHQVLTLQRSGVGIVTVLRKMEAAVHALSTKDLFWQAVDVKLKAHQRSVTDICLQVEDDTVTKRSRIALSKEAQACLAGDMQRVAKLMAVKADYEVIRELAKLESPDSPDQIGQDWDERVESLRQTQMRRFLKGCRDSLDKTAPEARNNFNGEEIRGKFLGKLSDALKVALSKHSPTTPGVTLFGKIKLKAKACLACDRPFTPSATGRPGPTPAGGISGAGVDQEDLPEEHSHITKDTFRPHTSHGRLGSPSRAGPVELFEPQHTSIHSVMSGGRSSPESPHVYRGGFKLPKHLKSPLHLPDGEDGSAFGIGHASPLLHKCPSMSGLTSNNDDQAHTRSRPSTSGGMRRKGRPPTSNNFSPPVTFSAGRPAGLGGHDGGGSVVSAVTARTGQGSASNGGGGVADGVVMGFHDSSGGNGRGGGGGTGGQSVGSKDAGEQHGAYYNDPVASAAGGFGNPPMPYYATTNTLSRPTTPHDGSVRLLT